MDEVARRARVGRAKPSDAQRLMELRVPSVLLGRSYETANYIETLNGGFVSVELAHNSN